MSPIAATLERSRVADVMSRPVLTIELDESLWDAWQLLFVSGLRHLAVIDTDGTCLGVLSDRAVLADVPLDTAALRERRVREVMARVPLAVVAPGDCPVVAAERMRDLSVEATPVIDDGRLVGMVTQTDLVHWVAGSSS